MELFNLRTYWSGLKEFISAFSLPLFYFWTVFAPLSSMKATIVEIVQYCCHLYHWHRSPLYATVASAAVSATAASALLQLALLLLVLLLFLLLLPLILLLLLAVDLNNVPVN
ncbi:uncharacterized protein [Montipora capricornis]|uniref:uncharacterized protein n=1 Tax=Montipora capricornis TaxID=246305 RepID=UPI0035F1CA30